MNVITLPKKEYKGLVQRQIQIEKKLVLLQKLVSEDLIEKSTPPVVLKRWERISKDIDIGKGHSFGSISEIRSWLKKL